MTFALGAGVISIGVTVSRAQVCAVELTASRPQGLARMFVGRRAEEAPMLAGQLFSLCGFSQSIASRLAVLRAAGSQMDESERLRSACGLLAERVFETLRSLVLNWPSSSTIERATAAGTPLREALAASQQIIGAARTGEMPTIGSDSSIERLVAASAALGVPVDNKPPAPTSLCGTILEETLRDGIFRPRRADALQAGDDRDVLDRLIRSTHYSARPSLPGRICETGAYARLCNKSVPDGPHMTARFRARMDDVRLCLALLRRISDGAGRGVLPLMIDGLLPAHGGYGVVECARGRLYHQAEIGADKTVSAYRMLAPTEWNFHPAGPFVETLLSARIGVGEIARLRVAQLAALFDPCVAFDISVSEASDA